MRSAKLALYLILAVTYGVNCERLSTVFTQTRDCFDCPMGVAGDLSIKVCGNRGCCFTFRLDNSENNFSRGKYDEFTGPATLGECDGFDLSDGTGSLQIGLYHEGTDGLLLDYAEILTDNRLVYCSVGYELDDDQYSQIICT